MKKSLSLAMAIPLLLAIACGGDSGSSTSSTPAPAAAAPASSGPTTGTAGVTGSIAFEGEAPAKQEISMNADPGCLAVHSEPVYADIVTVNDNSTLKDVFVYVKAGLENKTYPTPTAEVIFDQRGCHYTPHVMGVRAGQPIKILNSDGLLHNVHALPTKNDQFNVAMPKYKKVHTESFANAEVMVRVKCEVHPWMGAWIGVLDHPYFSVSDDTGAFSLEGLPAGDYVIEAWHEKYGSQEESVTLADGDVQEIAFVFKAE